MPFIRSSYIDGLGRAMGEVYGAITDQILINLAHYFPYWKPGESVPKSSFEYQANMLAQMGQVNRDTIRIIAQGLSGADTALKSVLEQAIMESVKKSNPDLLKGVMQGLISPVKDPIISPNQMNAFAYYYQQASEKLNIVNTVMLESTRQAYQATVSDIANRVQVTQSALNIGAGETVTGVSTWNQAVKHSIDRLKDGGIVGFIDHGGHRWSAEAYVSMDIRTTVANTARAAVWETNQDFGNDLYIVSYHDGARPKCYPWQNKVISSLDNARTVKDLDGNDIPVIAQSSTSYGAPDGLFGINCKHYPSPFIPGVSVLYDDSNIPDEKENAEVYEQTQEQRRLERKLREEKRDILMAKAQGATAEQLEPLRERARQTSQDIDDFCESTGLPRRKNREGIYTKREFPDPHTYDPVTFERDQKDMIDKYFSGGGSQTGYSFGQMTPNGEIPKVSTANVALQATPQAQNGFTMNYGKPFDDLSGYRKPQLKQFAEAKAMLDNAPEDIRKAWAKVANDLKTPVHDPTSSTEAFYRPSTRRTHFKSWKKAFEGSAYQRKGTTFFHEYGHNIDHALGGFAPTTDGYLSVSYGGGSFGKMLEQECEETIKAFYSQKGYTVAITDGQVGRDFVKEIKNKLDIYQRADISDMFERYMIQHYNIDFPFGVGHGRGYHLDARNTPVEAFAEMFSATATGSDSLDVIKQFFPKSYQIFEDMLRSVT